jgi:hypothetical protein
MKRIATLLALTALLLALAASAAVGKPGIGHPECRGLPAPPGHEKHGQKHCDAPQTTAPDTQILNVCPETLDYPEEIAWVVKTTPDGLDYQWRSVFVPQEGTGVFPWSTYPSTIDPLRVSYSPGSDPGDFRMEIRAVNASGEVDPTPAVCQFTALP